MDDDSPAVAPSANFKGKGVIPSLSNSAGREERIKASQVGADLPHGEGPPLVPFCPQLPQDKVEVNYEGNK